MRYSFASGYDEDYGMYFLDLVAVPDNEESEISHLDYVALFDDSFAKEIDEYGDYDVQFDGSTKKEKPIQQAIIIKATENSDGELVG